jgi:hypothetical protein
MRSDKSLSEDQRQLVNQVQFNCDISDANHAGDYTLCIYLLKMREYYRWIHALDFETQFDAEQMAQWLRAKEETWDQVVDEPFRPIQLHGTDFEPFDAQGINHALTGAGLFYHAGIGQKAVSHFFIADLAEQSLENGVRISVTGKEYARDLTAPPAISTASEIIVRRESLQRMCWERYQEWNWSRLDNPMGTALAFYPFDEDVPAALEAMVATEQHTLIQHEKGEMQISGEHGEEWSGMMLKLLGSRAELLARSVRDHLADCLQTLPFLAQQDNPAPIHFYFANLNYMRKELFPSAMQAYHAWVEHKDSRCLLALCSAASEHWRRILTSILEIHRLNPENPGAEIIALVENSKL